MIDDNNMNIEADKEIELLGMEMPLDIMADTLDESLLCTPSRGVAAIEPMSIAGDLSELNDVNSITPVRELNECRQTETAECAETTNNIPTNPDRPNTLTQEQAMSIKRKLGDLLQQASVLATHTESAKSNDDPNDVMLTGKELEARARQLSTEPRVILQSVELRRQEPLQAIPSGQSTPAPRTGTEQLIFVTDRTKNWLREKIGPCINSEKWKCLVCHWEAAKKRVQIHVKQHMVQMYCPCGFSRVSRDAVYDHQASHLAEGHQGHGPRAGYIFQVDHASYHQWTQMMGWEDPPNFPDPHPTLRGDDTPPTKGAFTERMARRRQKREERQERNKNRRRPPSTEVRRIQGPTDSNPPAPPQHSSRTSDHRSP